MSLWQTLEGLTEKMCELLHTSLVVQKMQGGQKPCGNWQLFGSGTCWGREKPRPLGGGAGFLGPRPGVAPRFQRSLVAPRACAVAAFVQPRLGPAGGRVAPIAIVAPPLVTRLDA